MRKILIINGPNLNLLGERETEIYGSKSLKEIEDECKEVFAKKDVDLVFFQSNSESEIIDVLQSSKEYNGIIINAGAFTHTSIAIHDTLKILKIPKIEIHISNIYSREEFRKKSFISPVVNGIIAGFGTSVYQLAINSITHLEQDE